MGLPSRGLPRPFRPIPDKKLSGEGQEGLGVPLAEALGFRYSPEQGFSWEEVLASGLFLFPDSYTAEDLVEGEVRGTPFASSDIALYARWSAR
jgi:hypothetical protein